MNLLHYLPLTPHFFLILVGIFLALVALMEFGVLNYVYANIGLPPRTALLLLFASLIGSYFNIEVATLPGEQILAQQEVMFFGVGYAVPVVVDWPGTIVAVNVGGALIPSLVSLYLLIRHDLWVRGVLATVCVTAVCHSVARPVPGLGIALPTIVPTLTAAIVALLLSRSRPAPLAYISGSLGTLIGADLLNLGSGPGLGCPCCFDRGRRDVQRNFSRRRHRGRPHKSLPAGAGQIDLTCKLILVGARPVSRPHAGFKRVFGRMRFAWHAERTRAGRRWVALREFTRRRAALVLLGAGETQDIK